MKAKYPLKPDPGWDKLKVFWLVGYEPSPGQAEFHLAKERYRLLCAGARFGKSMAAGHEILWYLLIPGSHIWTAGPKYDQASKEFRYCLDALRKLRAGGLPIPMAKVVDNVMAGQMRVELDFTPEGRTKDPEHVSFLQAKSWHEPDTLLGEEVDLLVLSEGALCPRSVWDRYLRARIGSRLGRVVIPTTPHGMDDFLYPLFYEPALRGDPDYWCGQYGVWDNPHHPKEDIEQARRTMNKLEFDEQYGGQFVSFSGRVYKEFQRDTHVVEPFEIPKEWPRFRCMDFGYEDPFACLWVASNEDGRLYVYREHYVRRQILSWHTDQIRKASGEGVAGVVPENYDYSVMDPAAKGKRVETGASIMSLMAEQGLPCMAGHNDLEAGIFRMMEWLRIDPVSGRPGLQVFSTCTNTIKEFEQYSWKPPKEGRNAHVEPEDGHDHALSSLRYLVMSRPRRFVGRNEVPRYSFRAYKEASKRAERRAREDVIGSRGDHLSRPSW